MTRVDKAFWVITCVICLWIGFFSGSIFEQTSFGYVVENNKAVADSLSASQDMVVFLRSGYLDRDSVLQEISSHKDCTFKIKSIIGSLN